MRGKRAVRDANAAPGPFPLRCAVRMRRDDRIHL